MHQYNAMNCMRTLFRGLTTKPWFGNSLTMQLDGVAWWDSILFEVNMSLEFDSSCRRG